MVEILGHRIDMDVPARNPSRWATRVGMKRGCRPHGIAPGTLVGAHRGIEFEGHRVLRGGGPARGAENSAAEVMMKWRRVSMGWQLPLKNMRNQGVGEYVAPTPPPVDKSHLRPCPLTKT
jgi:hypothetical protein